ncbi:alpha/beta fold hydrolase [Candidatus Eisenbacteria bacterium]|uniref:Alpha/beta fold hydrolase n=1 Tax=Eiseniibacteriota bacterium TaxID=2212470 RepID=A0ABV6YMU9_UNCEI
MPNFSTDGLSLFYDDRGSGDPLLILPGNTASSACHQGELDHFGKNYHAVSLDFRGTGKSDRIAPWPQDWWYRCTEDIASLLSHLGTKRCLLMGTSGGASIALLFAIRYPDLVAGVIADSTAEIYSPENLHKEVTERGRRTKEQVEFWTYAHGADWEAVVDADSKLLLDLADRGGDVFEGRLKTIRCPVLITGSRKDSFIPDIAEQSESMLRQIPDGRVFLLDEGDHPLMWTCPDAFRAASDRFLTELVK